MADFAPIREALATAEKSDTTITFWWRDDDVVADTTSLSRLLEMRQRHDIPLALAAIPATVDEAVARQISGTEKTCILLHGYTHTNHAPPQEKKAEFGPHRSIEAMVQEIGNGTRRLRDIFPAQVFAPVFVPPWNRVDENLLPFLPVAGLSGLSTFGNRKRHNPAPGLLQINTHIDPIAWHEGRGLVHSEQLIETSAGLIRQRVEHLSDEPVGLLTHHLVHDDAVWSFCDMLLSCLATSTAIQFADARNIFTEQQEKADNLG